MTRRQLMLIEGKMQIFYSAFLINVLNAAPENEAFSHQAIVCLKCRCISDWMSSNYCVDLKK